MRLIDADVAVENIEEWLNSVGTALIGKGLSYTCELMGCIEDVPTIDAVPVVRCRECKHRKYDDIFGMLWCNLDSCTKRVKPEDLEDYILNGWVKGRILRKKVFDELS